ncbi:hypothetical protein [Streptomyces sp. NPDC059176]|uniref:hypothetical protein n=1 Tax=unclassified Streptomyces TaxID=2593676 RepID=UPI00367EF117
MTTTDIPEPVRDLLAAIVETLTLPDPSSERMDMVRFETWVSERVHLIQLTGLPATGPPTSTSHTCAASPAGGERS